MGVDISSYAEVRENGDWRVVESELADFPFGWRCYGLFGFLAGVRNYSEVPTISQPRDLPSDLSDELRAISDEKDYVWSRSWLSLADLLAFDYDQVFWDRRVTKEVSPGHFDGAALAEEGEGEHLTVREFLGPAFFEHLEALKGMGAPDDVRIVFWFS